MSEDLRIALLALKAIVEHQRSLKETIAFDRVTWTLAYTAVNRLGYLDKPVPGVDGG